MDFLTRCNRDRDADAEQRARSMREHSSATLTACSCSHRCLTQQEVRGLIGEVLRTHVGEGWGGRWKIKLPANKPELTIAQIRRMSHEEIMLRQDEVDRALARACKRRKHMGTSSGPKKARFDQAADQQERHQHVERTSTVTVSWQVVLSLP